MGILAAGVYQGGSFIAHRISSDSNYGNKINIEEWERGLKNATVSSFDGPKLFRASDILTIIKPFRDDYLIACAIKNDNFYQLGLDFISSFSESIENNLRNPSTRSAKRDLNVALNYYIQKFSSSKIINEQKKSSDETTSSSSHSNSEFASLIKKAKDREGAVDNLGDRISDLRSDLSDLRKKTSKLQTVSVLKRRRFTILIVSAASIFILYVLYLIIKKGSKPLLDLLELQSHWASQTARLSNPQSSL